jgi:hypothetical protein
LRSRGSPPSLSHPIRRSPSGRPTRELEHARNGSLGAIFDHVGIAVSDLAVSERFYRTVLSLLGVEPSHADAELVEWEDWAIGPTDHEHPVTHGLHALMTRTAVSVRLIARAPVALVDHP